MSTATILALDIGTTATKGLVLAGDKVLARESAEYPLETSASGRAEQDPDLIVSHAVEVAKRLVFRQGAEQIDAISFSSAMHSLILTDAGGSAITPSITWADCRSAHQAALLRATPEGMALYHRTGTPIHPMAWPAKLKYLEEHDPQAFKRAARFVGIKEYLLLHLTGQMPCDHSLASATGLFNLAALDWDDEGLELVGVTRDRLPDLCRTTDCVTLGKRGAKILGLSPSTRVYIGAGDGCLSNLGAQAVSPGVAALNIGTSGALRTMIGSPNTDPLMRTFCYVLTDGCFITGGAVNGGGLALQWARDHLGYSSASDHGADYGALLDAAASVEPGANGLLFHPYLSGERAPLWATDASASFIGLTMVHDRRHMARAVAEGIFLNLYTVLQAIEAADAPVERILAVGGFARSAFLRQMVADVFGRAIEFPDDLDSSALGAARLAQFALGELSWEEITAAPSFAFNHCHPEKNSVGIYQRMHAIYAKVPQILSGVYGELASLRSDTGAPMKGSGKPQ
jgi:gluconokinase